MNITGHYIRVNSNDSAELRVSRLRGETNRYRVEGLALWGTSREHGPNTGELDAVFEARGNVLAFEEPNPIGGHPHRVTMTYSGSEVEVEEDNFIGVHGMNVTFDGVYRRAVSPIGVLARFRYALSRLFPR